MQQGAETLDILGARAWVPEILQATAQVLPVVVPGISGSWSPCLRHKGLDEDLSACVSTESCGTNVRNWGNGWLVGRALTPKQRLIT